LWVLLVAAGRDFPPLQAALVATYGLPAGAEPNLWVLIALALVGLRVATSLAPPPSGGAVPITSRR
jgi:hypothetical protein